MWSTATYFGSQAWTSRKNLLPPFLGTSLMSYPPDEFNLNNHRLKDLRSMQDFGLLRRFSWLQPQILRKNHLFYLVSFLLFSTFFYPSYIFLYFYLFICTSLLLSILGTFVNKTNISSQNKRPHITGHSASCLRTILTNSIAIPQSLSLRPESRPT